jgi:putative oxidoreductase
VKYIFVIGRVLFSLVFIVKPVEHFSQAMIDHAARMGVPFASILVPLWGALGLLGGLSILLGYKATTGAWLLVLFLIPTTLYMHPFWNSQEAFSKMMHSYCSWKNLAMLGAALMITQTGSGPLSLRKK